MLFADIEHRDFYLSRIGERADAYRKSMYYLIGLTPETRIKSNKILTEDGINIDVLQEDWQTGTTLRVCCLAFNLWNGYITKENGEDSIKPAAFTPEELFCCSYAPFFFEAIRLRFPEYTSLNWKEYIEVDI